MSDSTIYVTLSSLAEGTVPEVTSSVHVKEGAELTISVSWPSSASDTIQCDLDFSNSGDQDPFNDEMGGNTTFEMTRSSSNVAAEETLVVKSDAIVTTDAYDLTLTIDGVNYTKDPEIDVDPQ